MERNDFRYLRYIGEHHFEHRYATLSEAKATLSRFELAHPEKSPEGGGTPFLSDGKVLYLDNKDYHTLILGATGSMKTRVFILPEMYTLGLAGENVVVSDPKGEIYLSTSGWFAKQGYDVKVFDLRNPAQSDCWNPLYESFQLYHGGIAERDTARTLVNDFTAFLGEGMKSSKDPFWEVSGTGFVQGAIMTMFAFASSAEEISMRSISSFANATFSHDLNDPKDNEVARFCEKLPDDSLIKEKLYQVAVTAENTKKGILGIVYSEVAPFVLSDSISYVTSKNTIDVHAFNDETKKTILYIIVPDEKTTYHFLAAALIKQIYECAVGDASKRPSLQLPRRLNFVLDEFANMPEIPDMGSMISAARSRNIRFTLVVQNNAQLIKNYGRDAAETIKSNCLNWVFLSSKEQDLLNQLQEMGGHTTSSPSSPYVLSMEDLTGLKKRWGGAEAMIFLSRSAPFVSFMPDIKTYDFPSYPPVKKVPHLERLPFFIFSKEIPPLSREIILKKTGEASAEESPVDPAKPQAKSWGSDWDDLPTPNSGGFNKSEAPKEKPEPKDEASDETSIPKHAPEEGPSPEFKKLYDDLMKRKKKAGN